VPCRLCIQPLMYCTEPLMCRAAYVLSPNAPGGLYTKQLMCRAAYVLSPYLLALMCGAPMYWSSYVLELPMC